MKKHFYFLFSIILLTACNKEPQAGFEFDTDTYMPGDKITMSNTSQNGKSFKWEFPDGQIYTDYEKSSRNYTLSQTQPLGTFKVSLSAYSKNGKKSSSFSKSTTIVAPSGSCVFWHATPWTGGPILVTVNSLSNYIISFYPSTQIPTCGTSGVAQFSLPVGTYNYYAYTSSASWSGSVTITKRGCKVVELP